MCGIGGFLVQRASSGHFETALRSMGDAIGHRGPDDATIWHESEAGIGLAHRRLAIIDLSPAGRQPMASASGAYVLAYNGEIYNHLDIRKALEDVGQAPNWRGHSDTETLLAATEAWGLSAALTRCIGMFAVALWDKRARTLTLARDRIGEKPLYYGWQDGTFLFASELKAFKAYPGFAAEIDRHALTLLLRHNYIPAPYSIYAGIRKLEPGHLMTVSLAGERSGPTAYWFETDIMAQGVRSPSDASPNELVDGLEKLLLSAVGGQMMSDVPLGAFLSGGVDSSTIVALMQQLSAKPIKTFTIGFGEDAHNEAPYAKAVAEHLGTDHTELYVSAADALAIIPRLPSIYDEPFADSSQIPTFLVSQLASQHVKVSLSGDGGDELFAGYNRYALTQQLWGKIKRLPMPVRTAIANGLLAVPAQRWNSIAGPLSGILPASLRQANIGDKLHKGANVLGVANMDELYRGLVSLWSRPSDVVLGAREPETPLTSLPDALRGVTGVERMMALDAITYLPDDILTKVDRAAMSVSLETRVPLLDHRVFEYAWSMPLAVKSRDGQTKWPLRQVLYKYVPRELIERPKAGFAIPVDQWLRGPLRDWAEAQLDEARIRREGYFDPTPIRTRWNEHLSGRRNWGAHLWTVLMFQAWLES
jgi:asparagine synthase (glutamine-hydrolysing)